MSSGSMSWEQAQPLLHKVPAAAPLSAAIANTGSKTEGTLFDRGFIWNALIKALWSKQLNKSLVARLEKENEAGSKWWLYFN